MTSRIVKPEFPVEPDKTGAAASETTPSGTLYAPETKEQAAEVPPEPKHECNPPERYSVWYYSEETSAGAEKKLPAGTLFHCECGVWWERIIYHSTYHDEYTHYWHEVGRWDFKARKRIRLLEEKERAKRIMEIVNDVYGTER
jgi:hypothetical protein